MDIEKEITDIKRNLKEANTKSEYDLVANRFKIVWKYQQENNPKNNKINKELKQILEDIKEKKKTIDQAIPVEKKKEVRIESTEEIPQPPPPLPALSQKEQEELPP